MSGALQILRMELRNWLHIRRLKQYCREYARHNDIAVADAMWQLNRYVRHLLPDNPERKNIYLLKTALIRLWYEQGRASSVTKEIQKFDCWDCLGTGWDSHEWYETDTKEPCLKCDGSGIYKQYVLYRFAFQIGNRRFIWHQPESLVDWDVELTDSAIWIYENRHLTPFVLDSKIAQTKFFIVHQYLKQNGIDATPDLNIRLLSIFRHAFEQTSLYRWYLRQRIHQLRKKIEMQIQADSINVKPTFENDDIPF